MVSRFIRGKAGSILLTGAIIAGLVVVADKFNLGTRVAFGARSVGQAAGQTITQPIAGLTETLTSGIDDIAKQAQGLFGSLASAGADVQGAFTGDRNAIGNFFNQPPNETIQDKRIPIPKGVVDLSKLFSPRQIERRLNIGRENQSIVNPRLREEFFTRTGLTAESFSDPAKRESLLQKTIGEQIKKFPQFFGSSQPFE